jgi:dTDP-4-dehydrorhamnose reductase
MAERDEVRVVADQIGTPTSCRSLAKSIWKLAARNAAGIFHVTDSGAASWYDFAVAIRDEARTAGSLSREPEVVPIATSDFPTPARRPAYSVLDKSRTWHELGKPSRHWRVELAATLRGEHG